jgi:hypothetical protein
MSANKYSETQRYEPYTATDKAFMKREGDPCRHCLRPLLDHYNGRCPISDDDEALDPPDRTAPASTNGD